MGAIQVLDRGIPTPAEAQRLALWRPRDIGGFARPQPLSFCPGPEQLHRFGNARQIGLDGALQEVDLPQPPAFLGIGVEPSDAKQHVDRRDVALHCERGLGGPGYPIGKVLAVLRIHDRKPGIGRDQQRTAAFSPTRSTSNLLLSRGSVSLQRAKTSFPLTALLRWEGSARDR